MSDFFAVVFLLFFLDEIFASKVTFSSISFNNNPKYANANAVIGLNSGNETYLNLTATIFDDLEKKLVKSGGETL